MIIPWQELEEITLKNLIIEIITREGTDYGAKPLDLQDKLRTVLRKLQTNEVAVRWDFETETTSLVNLKP